MLLEAVVQRDDTSLAQLVEIAREAGTSGVRILSETPGKKPTYHCNILSKGTACQSSSADGRPIDSQPDPDALEYPIKVSHITVLSIAIRGTAWRPPLRAEASNSRSKSTSYPATQANTLFGET